MRLTQRFFSLWITGCMMIMIHAVHSQGFDNGSDGSHGPILVDESTGDVVMPVPEDGIIHCTTLTVTDNKTLSFLKNTRNTPVYILATGDVTLGSSSGHGYINVSGKGAQESSSGAGGPGGYDGGFPGPLPSSGFGPGGGSFGHYTDNAELEAITRGGGSYGTEGSQGDSVLRSYGSPLLVPLIGGSGGGGGYNAIAPNESSFHYGGGGGGGAILISSNSQIVCHDGSGGYLAQINAQGGSSFSNLGGGSGGAIRLVAPYLSGRISLRINGEDGGGDGRVRIDCLNHDLSISNPDSRAVFGSNMVIFPANMPSLRVIEIAGQAIDNAQTGSATYILPPGTPNSQTIGVEVENFGTQVPLVAVISPEVGDKIRTEFTVDNTEGGVSTGSVQVEIPPGQLCQIDVWTR